MADRPGLHNNDPHSRLRLLKITAQRRWPFYPSDSNCRSAPSLSCGHGITVRLQEPMPRRPGRSDFVAQLLFPAFAHWNKNELAWAPMAPSPAPHTIKAAVVLRKSRRDQCGFMISPFLPGTQAPRNTSIWRRWLSEQFIDLQCFRAESGDDRLG